VIVDLDREALWKYRSDYEEPRDFDEFWRDTLSSAAGHDPELITNAEPYAEITGYLSAKRTSVAEVFATLAYFDGIGFAKRATAPAWFSAGLMDDVCPPSTAFGAFHSYGGPKQIQLWDYNGHEAGGSYDLEIVLAAFESLLSPGDLRPESEES
jgi:cephalosporin-C deacetylase-like acetyl esterase